MELRLHQIAKILQSERKLQAEAPGANAYYQYTLLTYQIVWLDETFAIVCFAGHQQSSCQRGDIGLRGAIMINLWYHNRCL